MTGAAQLEALSKALGDWNADSVGGRAIAGGWRAFMAGEPRPRPAWPYLRERGWSAAKAYCVELASRAEASGQSASHDSAARLEVRAIAGELAALLGAERFAGVDDAPRLAASLDKAARLGFVIRAHVESARWDLKRAAWRLQELAKESGE